MAGHVSFGRLLRLRALDIAPETNGIDFTHLKFKDSFAKIMLV
jgi:hypothetical protein